jgi:NTP pyrophosphatase (non-canonical NTP hydrolase)
VKITPAVTAEVREVNTALGWREGHTTMGEYVALLHAEVSEALEAYRDHRLADATGCPSCSTGLPKPEGVGSEFADVLIRVIDMCDVFGIPLDTEASRDSFAYCTTFGENIAELHGLIARAYGLWVVPDLGRWSAFQDILDFLRLCCTEYKIDLEAEYRRKMAYSRTRPYQHGGRTLSGPKVPA